jgi:hypothetical protein
MTTIEHPDWITTADGRDLYRTERRVDRPVVTVHRGRPPSVFNPRSWAELLYALVDLGPAIAFFVGTITLLAVGGGLSVIWVGVPILAAALVFARFGGLIQRALAAALLDHHVHGPDGVRRKRSGPLGALTGVISDPAGWRMVGYHCVKIALAPFTFGVSLGLYAAGLGSFTYPLWLDDLPLVRGDDGVLHRGWEMFPGFHIDTWPAMLVQMAIGAVLLWLAPRVVRFLTTLDRVLISTLLGGRDR